MDWLRSAWRSRSWQRVPTTAAPAMPGQFPQLQTQETTPSRNLLATVEMFIGKVLTKPVTFLVYAVLSILYKFLKVLYFLDKPKDRSSLNSGTTVNNALMNDPIARAENFVRGLEDSLLPSQQFSLYHSDSAIEHLPPFFQGSYTQALFMASTRGKFLFVFLTNSMSEGSQSLFNKVVTNPKFTSIFKNNENTLIWGGDVTDPEAYQLANSLNITKFPMIGLLCLARTTSMTPEGPKKSSPRISLILKVQGGLRESQDTEALIHSKFLKRMRKYEPDLAIIRAELRERYLADLMRRRQDADYQRSLLRDKQKKEQQAQQKLAGKYLKWRQPYFKQLKLNKEVHNTLRIAIKFENGKRDTIHFPKDSPIEDVFMFVALHNKDMLEDTYETTMSEADAERMFGNFKMPFDFNLTSTIPPRPTLNDYDMQTPIKDVPFIYPSGLLMVEKS